MEEAPLISVLLAVYEPRLDWLEKQLASLERQTYPRLRLYVADDGSKKVPEESIRRCLREQIRSFPWSYERLRDNQGSNAAFARLTGRAKGDFFACCDQDDEWHPQKLEILYKAMERERAQLACCDMAVMDARGRVTAGSLTDARRRCLFRSGEELWRSLWYTNFVSGCAMLLRAETARAALPLCPYMHYDHYMALCAAERGRIVSVPLPLLRHREHGANQTGLLAGVEDKESYYRLRVENKLRAVAWLCEHHSGPPELEETLSAAREWLEARSRYARGDFRAGAEIWHRRDFSPESAVFELAAPFLPEAIFRRILSLARNNRI